MSSSKLRDLYATDAQAESDGTWVTLKGSVRVKVRSENSVEVRETARRIDKKYRAQMLTDGLSAATQDERELELCATILVADWDRSWFECDPSRENIRAVLTELPALRRDIVFASRMEENFRAQEVKQMAGNSVAPSSPASA